MVWSGNIRPKGWIRIPHFCHCYWKGWMIPQLCIVVRDEFAQLRVGWLNGFSNDFCHWLTLCTKSNSFTRRQYVEHTLGIATNLSLSCNGVADSWCSQIMYWQGINPQRPCSIQLTGLDKLFQTNMPSSVQHAKTVGRCRPTEPSNPYTLGYQWLNVIAVMYYM